MAHDTGQGAERRDARRRDLELGPNPDPTRERLEQRAGVGGRARPATSDAGARRMPGGQRRRQQLVRVYARNPGADGRVGRGSDPSNRCSRRRAISASTTAATSSPSGRAPRSTRAGSPTSTARRWRFSSTSRHVIAASACSCSRQEAPTNARDGVADWSVRPFPERFSFIQIVRAWGAWRRAHPDMPCRLALHLVAPSVYMEIASGRVDVLELLSCADVGFWAEILTDSGDVERRLFQVEQDLPLSQIVSEMNLSPDHWMVQVSPAPTLDQPVHRLAAALSTTLQDLGVVPGQHASFSKGVGCCAVCCTLSPSRDPLSAVRITKCSRGPTPARSRSAASPGPSRDPGPVCLDRRSSPSAARGSSRLEAA